MSDEEFAHIEQLAANLEPNDDSVEAIPVKGTVLSQKLD